MSFQTNSSHAMNGSLADIHAAELVLNIYESGLSGRLRFTQNKMRRDIYFRKGDIIFAHSSLPQERLGEILTRLGKIGVQEFNAVVREVAEGKRLGETLVDRGYLSTMDLYVGLNYQVQHILYSVFDWDFGLYEFEEEIRNVQKEISVRVSTPDLVVRGVRNINNLNVLERALGDDENRIVLHQSSPRLRRTDFDYQEETVLDCVNGKANIHELRKCSKLSSLEFGRAMFSLLLSGMIGFENEHQKASEDSNNWLLDLFEPDTQAVESVFPQSIEIPMRFQEKRPLDSFSESELRDLIVFTSQKFLVATDEEVLNLNLGCSEDEMQNSYDYLTRIFHHCYYSSDQFHDLKDTLKAIVDRLAQAHRNLTKVDGDIQRIDSQESTFAAKEEKKTLTDIPLQDSAELDRKEYSIEQKEIGLAGNAKPEEPFPAPDGIYSDQDPLDVPILLPPMNEEERREEIGYVRELTLKELEEAVTGHPADVEFLRSFGKKLQQAGKPHEGEKHLLRALEIEPRNVENHFALAEFYQKQGLKLKAFMHLNIVLQMDPNNKKALSLLGVSKRKSMLFSIERTNPAKRLH